MFRSQCLETCHGQEISRKPAGGPAGARVCQLLDIWPTGGAHSPYGDAPARSGPGIHRITRVAASLGRLAADEVLRARFLTRILGSGTGTGGVPSSHGGQAATGTATRACSDRADGKHVARPGSRPSARPEPER